MEFPSGLFQCFLAILKQQLDLPSALSLSDYLPQSADYPIYKASLLVGPISASLSYCLSPTTTVSSKKE